MTPLEKVAVAISGAPFPSTQSIRKARAALLALAEAEFPDCMEFQDGKETVILHPNNGSSKWLFRKFCRAIANEGQSDG
jgi:hypothetical protein